jgi:hypothetical protein
MLLALACLSVTHYIFSKFMKEQMLMGKALKSETRSLSLSLALTLLSFAPLFHKTGQDKTRLSPSSLSSLFHAPPSLSCLSRNDYDMTGDSVMNVEVFDAGSNSNNIPLVCSLSYFSF